MEWKRGITRAVVVLGFVGAFASCGGGPGEYAGRSSETARLLTPDSASLARTALDTVDHASGIVSEILRFDLHGDSVRIVTVPDRRKNVIVDGMAVVWLRRDGRVLRVIYTDSA